MKKSKIALGIVIAFGLVSTGGAWYTGKLVEKQIDEGVAQLNQKIKTAYPQSDLQLTRDGYRRHLFSSQTRLILKRNSASQTEGQLLAPGQQLVFNETISHGPFPLAQLKRFNLLPAMASVHSVLEKNDSDAVKALFQISHDRSPVEADTRIGYSHSSNTRLTINPLGFSQGSSTVDIQPIYASIDTDKSLNAFKLDAQSGDIRIGFNTRHQLKAMLVLKGLTLSADSTPSPEGLRVGRQQLSFNALDYHIDNQHALQLGPAEISTDLKSRNNLLNSDIQYRVDNIRLNSQPLGDAALTGRLIGFNAAGIKQFVDGEDDYQPALQQSGESLLQKMALLLQGAPRVIIDNLSLKNGQGTSQFTLNAAFNDPAKVTTPARNLSEVLNQLFRQLDATLRISKPMATQWVKAVGQSRGFSEEEAHKLAQQQIDGLAAIGEMFHLSRTDQDNIISALSYENGNVTVNDRKITLKEFLQQYIPEGNAVADDNQ